MSRQNGCSAAPPAFPLSAALADPSPYGLLGLGSTVFLFSLAGAGLLPVGAQLLGMILIYGGAVQVLAGLADWRRGGVFGAVAFTSFGLFWISLVALLLLPGEGLGHPPQTAAVVSYQVMWGIFALILAAGSPRSGRALGAVFALLAVFLLLLAASSAFPMDSWRAAGGAAGAGCGLAALGAGASRLVRLGRLEA